MATSGTSDGKPISLYIHVPFCVSKCRYCDFYSESYNAALADDYCEALIVEWELLKNAYSLHTTPIATIYFGGGTPSVLAPDQWEKIIDGLIRLCNLAPGYEWSIECNPDSFSEELARYWLASGVTRLSFGVQSLDERYLRLMGRAHNVRQAFDVLKNPILARFASVGVDCMYGLPGQTVQTLRTTVEGLLALPVVRHLSAYELTLHEGTRFRRHMRLLPSPSEETVVAMIETIMRITADRGFERYEISNFCLPGHRCRHNQTYWRHGPYIGLGPAAHSYRAPARFSNINNLEAYLSALLAKKVLPVDFMECLDTQTIAREMVFLGLRTIEGINEEDFYRATGRAFASDERKRKLDAFIDRQLVRYVRPFWSLTEKGMLLADAIAADLM